MFLQSPGVDDGPVHPILRVGVVRDLLGRFGAGVGAVVSSSRRPFEVLLHLPLQPDVAVAKSEGCLNTRPQAASAKGIASAMCPAGFM